MHAVVFKTADCGQGFSLFFVLFRFELFITVVCSLPVSPAHSQRTQLSIVVSSSHVHICSVVRHLSLRQRQPWREGAEHTRTHIMTAAAHGAPSRRFSLWIVVAVLAVIIATGKVIIVCPRHELVDM